MSNSLNANLQPVARGGRTEMSFQADLDHLQRASAPLAGCPAPWWVAGGWAIGLFLGWRTRPHHDVDVAILRRDQITVQHHLTDWRLRWVEPRSGGRFHPWRCDEWLALPVHEIHGTHRDGQTIELLLNEAKGETWHFRREQRIQRPLHLVGRSTAEGIPYLAPKVVLLYKAQELRATDAADFAVAREALDADQRAWLAQALRLTTADHPWLAAL